MQKILPITRVIMRRVHWIFKDEKEEEEVASENVVEVDSQELARATTTLKTITVRKQKVVALKCPPPFTLKIPVNIVRILKCTQH